MDEQTIVATVSRAATNFFGMMLGQPLDIGGVTLENGSRTESQNMVALIGFAGQWIGSGLIGCSPEFACRIASLMLTTEFTAVNEDVIDAFAEMSNMIFGNVKTELEPHLGPMGLSIPTVIFGQTFTTRTVSQEVWRVFPLKAAGGEMELKFCLTPNHELQKLKRSALRTPADLAVQHA